MLSKNVNNKKCAPKLVIFNETKENDSDDSDDFWHRKLTLKGPWRKMVPSRLPFLNSEIGIYFSKFWFQQLYQLEYKLCQHLDKNTDDQNALFDHKSRCCI